MAPLMSGMARPGADIMGQIGVVRVKRLVALAMFAAELLEEPGGLGTVQLGGAGVRHRLDQLVLGAQGAAGRSALRTSDRPPPDSGARLPESAEK